MRIKECEMAQSSVLTVKIERNTGEPFPLANMYVLVCVELDYHRAQYSVERDTRISFCIWATELESGISSSNTYSSTRPNRARDVELDEVDIELHNHRARHQIHGTSKRMTTSSSIT